MSADDSYAVRLLRALEATVKGNGRPQLAAALQRIAQRITSAPDAQPVLEELGAVREWEEFAIRLMWCLRERESLRPESEEKGLLSYHLEELKVACAGSVKEVRPEPPPRSMDFDEALLEFGKAAEGVKRSAFHDGQFSEIPRAQLDTIRQHTETLRRVAAAEANQDVQKFCSAFILFLEYVSDRDLLRDVRVANLLDNANLTIQTVHQAVGAEEYDALQQMIELLESPGTLLE